MERHSSTAQSPVVNHDSEGCSHTPDQSVVELRIPVTCPAGEQVEHVPDGAVVVTWPEERATDTRYVAGSVLRQYRDPGLGLFVGSKAKIGDQRRAFGGGHAELPVA